VGIEKFGRADVAAQRVNRLVPGHVHHLEYRGAVRVCRRHEARAQGMAGKPCPVAILGQPKPLLHTNDRSCMPVNLAGGQAG
jgi:hypothetical protein